MQFIDYDKWWRSRGHKSKNKGLIITNICIVILASCIPTIVFIFSFCVVLLCVFTFWVPSWDVRNDFPIKTMFKSSLFPVVRMRAHVLFTLFCLFAYSVVHHILCCVFYLFFSGVEGLSCQLLWIAHFWYFWYSLTCIYQLIISKSATTSTTSRAGSDYSSG